MRTKNKHFQAIPFCQSVKFTKLIQYIHVTGAKHYNISFFLNTSKFPFPSHLLVPVIDHLYAHITRTIVALYQKKTSTAILFSTVQVFFLRERSNFSRLTAADVNPWKRLVQAANPISRLVYLTRRLHIGQLATADVAYKLTAWVPFTNLTRAYTRDGLNGPKIKRCSLVCRGDSPFV